MVLGLLNTFKRVNFALPNNNVRVPATLGTITSTARRPAGDPIRAEGEFLMKRGADIRVGRTPTRRGARRAWHGMGRDESRTGRQECLRHRVCL
jgi:hypothetical protein